MNKRILLPLSLVTIFTTTSCGRSFNRLKFNPIDFSDRFVCLERIKAAQKDEDGINYKLPDVASITMTYQISVNGFIRFAGTSCENINISLRGPATVEWDIPHEYMKFTGPWEKYHIVRDSYDNKFYCACDYLRGKTVKKKKYIVPFEEEYNSNFANLVASYADTYLSFGNEDITYITEGSIPFIQLGITGFANRYMMIQTTPINAGDDLFGEGYAADAGQLRELYSDSKDGHFFREIMGSNDDASLSCNFKGKTNLEDYRNLPKLGKKFKNASGYADFDFFTAWKNNIIYQNDYVLDAHILTEEDDTMSLDIDVDIKQDLKEQCTVEAIDLSKYPLPIE